MAFIAYYLIVFPLSHLSLRIIYSLSALLYFILRFIYPYREKVILKNLRSAFPEKSEAEIQTLKHKFYRHFADLLAEGIKNLSISEKELRKRVKIKNPEIIEELYRNKQNVLLISGHYNNWEWLISAQNFLLPHKAVGIGMPMSSKFWDKKVNQQRSRFGMHIIHSKNVRDFFKTNQDLVATLVLGDQSPGDSKKAFWMNFLNQPTAVQFGCEMLAHNHRQAVVFFATRKIKRGYYEIEFELITKDPQQNAWGEITEKHTSLLEKEILKHPEYWIWSHKRWKRDVPEDLESLKEQQRTSFNKKFKSHVE